MDEDLIKYQNELSKLLSWFEWYDTQNIQYQRDIRMYNNSDIAIDELDSKANQNSTRIKELRNLINTKWANKNNEIIE